MFSVTTPRAVRTTGAVFAAALVRDDMTTTAPYPTAETTTGPVAGAMFSFLLSALVNRVTKREIFEM